MPYNPMPKPVSYPCPHCDNTDAVLLPTVGDYSAHQCPTCGLYRISGTSGARFRHGSADTKSAHFVKMGDHKWLEP